MNEDDATILAQRRAQNVSSTAFAVRMAAYKRPTRDSTVSRVRGSQSGSPTDMYPFQSTPGNFVMNCPTPSASRWKNGTGFARRFFQAAEYSCCVMASSEPTTGVPSAASFLRAAFPICSNRKPAKCVRKITGRWTGTYSIRALQHGIQSQTPSKMQIPAAPILSFALAPCPNCQTSHAKQSGDREHAAHSRHQRHGRHRKSHQRGTNGTIAECLDEEWIDSRAQNNPWGSVRGVGTK